MTTIKSIKVKINREVSKRLINKLTKYSWYTKGVQESRRELALLKK